MFEGFTQSAIRTVMHAQLEARAMGWNFVGTEHLLLGLLAARRGIAATALNEAGVTLERARKEAEEITKRGSAPPIAEIPFTPRSKRILESSWDWARQMGSESIASQHILLALLSEGEGIAFRILTLLKVDQDKLKERIFALSETSTDEDPRLIQEPDIGIYAKGTLYGAQGAGALGWQMPLRSPRETGSSGVPSTISEGRKRSEPKTLQDWFSPAAIGAVTCAESFAEMRGAEEVSADDLLRALTDASLALPPDTVTALVDCIGTEIQKAARPSSEPTLSKSVLQIFLAAHEHMKA